MSKKTPNIVPAAADAPKATPFEGDGDHLYRGPENVKAGEWYWVSEVADSDDDGSEDGIPVKKGETWRWLGCVMHIGSNYVKVESPPSHTRGYSSERIHFDDFEKRLTFAPDAEQHIAEQQALYQKRVNVLLQEVRDVTARLGVVPQQEIADHSDSHAGQNALVVVSQQPDTKAYKKALIKAQKETLPTIFKNIERATVELARWMNASTLPLLASIPPMERSIDAVKDRIYTIELYAGLTEEAVKCCDGKPAAPNEKLHVMQRRLYMDEECLANYEAGGMEFKDIHKFDKWLSKPKNRDRILPFPRALVAFRVRRGTKYREDEGNIRRMYVNFELAKADEITFLYLRNGEQVWRIDCNIDFGEMIVPNRGQFDPSVPMMVKCRYSGTVEEFMPKQRWESLVVEEEARHKQYVKWEKVHPGADYWDNPYRTGIHFDWEYKTDAWKPFDQSTVYFDDALKEIADQIKGYNRIAVIVQGLFDRSEALHPHPPVRMWDPESFASHVEIVYDAVTLTHGDKPDFEAFRQRLNILIDEKSVLTGQEDFWLRREAVRENNRIARDYRFRGTPPNYVRYRPYEDPGPGLVRVPDEWKRRTKKALFRWERGHRNGRRWNERVATSIEVPISELFNVSAYKPGDFKQFYADPRTRREYIKWAPLLLAAEDFHAGKTKRKNTHPFDSTE